jgi:hypothetical protein
MGVVTGRYKVSVAVEDRLNIFSFLSIDPEE